jgi:transcriptional regulator with XRE-family HTH domain
MLKLRLRELRKRGPTKITLEEVAAAIGSNAPTLSRLERGQQFPTGEQIASLAQFYGVQPHELFETYKMADPGFERIKRLLEQAPPDDLEKALRVLEVVLGREAPTE